MTMDVNEKLGQSLSAGQNWEKRATNLPGVSLLKLPTSKKSAIYSYRDNSYKYQYGFRYEEKRNNNQVWFRARTINLLLANPKVIELAKKIEVVNPKVKGDSSKSAGNTDVFEI